MAPRCTAALLIASLAGCGGGDSAAPAAAPAPSPVPTGKITLSSTNYRNASTLAMGVSSSAFWYSRLAVEVVNDLLNVPLNFLPTPCPASGSMSLELTDQNKDRSLDPGDTVHIRWNQCSALGTTTTGLMRVELTAATQIPGGREYQITVIIADLNIDSGQMGIPPFAVNFSAPVHYTHTATSDHTVINGADFTSGQVAGDPGTSELVIDYLQDYASQTYTYTVSGTVTSNALGGQFDFATPLPFTGVVGEYPGMGKMTLAGGANSSARLSEEGIAAADNATVFIAVDSNGDGIVDASDAQIPWINVVPQRLFSSFTEQPGVVGVPIP